MRRITLKKVGSIDINNNIHHINLHKGLNVITGDRETGKSTILQIIDYCFGKSTNDSIPKTITKITTWHFIVCVLGDASFLLARHSTSSSRFVLSNLKKDETNYFDIINNSKKIDWNETNRLIFEKNGIEAETLFDYATKQDKRITFRNCISLCLQRDDDVTSKDVLLYRLNNENKKRSFKAEFPLLAGMIDFNFYKEYDELLSYNREIDKLKNRINNYKEDEELSEIKSLIKTLFLETNNNIDIDIIDNKESYLKLKRNLDIFDPYDSKAIDSIKEIKYNLTKYEKHLSELNYKLRQIELQTQSFNEISYKLNESQEKAMIIEDIIEDLRLDDSIYKSFSSLRRVVNEELSKININKNNNLEYEKIKIRKEIKIVQEKRKEILAIYNNLLSQNIEQSNYVDKIKNLYRLESQIEAKFDVFENYLNDMKNKLHEYENKVSILEPKLNLKKDDLNQRKKMFEENVSTYMNEDVKDFYPEFEHKSKKIGFSLDKLSCYYETSEERVYLSGWGSDNNVLFAHVASILSIQRTLSNYGSCVPSFIVFDQLSRPYFPDSIDIQKSKDMISLNQIYDVILRVIKEVSNNTNDMLQVIVLEHANEGMSKSYLESKIKDDNGNLITFTNGIKYIDESIIMTSIFDDERKSKKEKS